MITSIKLFRRTILKVISSRNNKHSKIYPKKTQMRHLLWQNLKAVGFLSLNSTWVNCNQNTNNLKKYTQIFKRMKKSQGDSVPSLTATNVNFQSLTTYSSTCPKSKRVTLRPRLELPSQSLLMIPLIRRNLPIKLTVYWVSTTAGSLLIMNILASRLPKLSKIQIQSSESVWNQLGWGLRWIIRLISSVTKNTISSYPLPKNNSRRQIMRAITNSKISQSIKYLILNETAIVLREISIAQEGNQGTCLRIHQLECRAKTMVYRFHLSKDAFLHTICSTNRGLTRIEARFVVPKHDSSWWAYNSKRLKMKCSVLAHASGPIR